MGGIRNQRGCLVQSPKLAVHFPDSRELAHRWPSGRQIRTMRPIADVLASMPRPQRHEEVYRPPEIPVCPICQGAGWLRMDVPLGHPSFGRLFKCECGKHSEERIRLAEMR